MASQFGKAKAKLSDPGNTDCPEDTRLSNGDNAYQIGAEIGRGGYAIVYAAFNVNNGSSVAVKRFPLDKIDAESLGNIEAEIELMKNLNHPNIVKYVDTIKTKSYLHIVLEYMENGSLANMIKKFGSFTESLTAIYITQVLRGLKYLHEQGVLHRDIKGANILTTKDGMVKLADFGVAMRMNDAQSDEQDVLGSPYWIAPEIIEMSPPTPACDIWSLGCIIIELLTGRPPYFDLVPMAALFRIVQDDYPPFPDGISQALREFLLLCFKKDPMMRSSAAKLIEHPWLHNSSSSTANKLTDTSRLLAKSQSIADMGDSSSGDRDSQENSIVNTIKKHQEETEASSPKARRSGHKTSGANDFLTRTDFGPVSPTPKSKALAAARRALSHKRSSFKLDVKNIECDSKSPVVRIRKINKVSSKSFTRNARMDSFEDSSTGEGVSTTASGKHVNVPALVISATSKGAHSEYDSLSDADTDENGNGSEGLPVTHHRELAKEERQKRGDSTIDRFSGLSPDAINTTPLTHSRVSTKFPDSEDWDNSMGDDDDEEDWDADMIDPDAATPKSGSSNGPRAFNFDNTAMDSLSPKNDTVVPLGSSVKLGSSRSAKLKAMGMKISSEESMGIDDNDWDDDIEHDEDKLWEPRTIINEKKTDIDINKIPQSGKVINMSNVSASTGAALPISSSRLATARGRHVPQLMHEDFDNVFEEEAEQQPQGSKSKLERSNSRKPMLQDYIEHTEDIDNFDDLLSSPMTSGGLSPGIAASPTKAKARGGFIGKALMGKGTSTTAAGTRLVSPRGPRLNSPRFGTGSGSKLSSVRGASGGVKSIGSLSDPSNVSHTSSGGELDDFFVDEEDGKAVFNPGKKLADTLRQRMKMNTQATADVEHDEFINIQFDETDFLQNEQKDAHSRRTKDVIELMAKIKPETREFEVINYCDQLMNMFNDFPEQRNFLIDTYGVMPIMEMFEARLSVAAPRGAGRWATGAKIVRPYVLRVINKIIEGSIRAQEQLSLMGLIPSVMSLFQKSYNMDEFVSAMHSQSNDASSHESGDDTERSPQLSRPNSNIDLNCNSTSSSYLGPDGTRAAVTIVPDVNPVTLEAARFIHLISSTSSLTLQMLIGAGGLSVLTSMVSFGVGISTSSFSSLNPEIYNECKDAGGLASKDSVGRAETIKGASFDNEDSFNPDASHTLPANAPPTPLKSVMSLYSSSMYDKFSSTDYTEELSTTPTASGRRRSGNVAVIDVESRRMSGKFFSIPGINVSGNGASSVLASHSMDLNISNNASMSSLAPTASESRSPVLSPRHPDKEANAKIDHTNSDNNLGDFLSKSSSEEGVDPSSFQSETLTDNVAQSAAQQQRSDLYKPPSSVHSLLIFQMGVDCVMSVFAVQSSRTRDFCRLFVKLGLLPHLSIAFQNMLPLFYCQLEADSVRMGSSGNSLVANHGSMYYNPSSNTVGPKLDSSSAFPLAGSQDSENSQERKYTEALATLFFKFSRSDRVVVETMAHNKFGVVSIIVMALKAPELRRMPGSVATTPGPTPRGSDKNPSLTATSTSTEFSPRLSEQNVTAHNTFDSPPSALSSTISGIPKFVDSVAFTARSNKRKLTPAYCEIIELLLKTLKNLSMEPSALPDLEMAGTIQVLIPLMSGPMADRAKNHILPFMFNMVRISRVSKTRQDIAARLGIVPILKKVITDGSHLRQFALQILFDLAHSSAITREELWKNDCVPFFVGLLKDNYWQKPSMNSLATWMHYEAAKVEKVLVEPNNLKRFVDFFRSASPDVIHELHRPWLDMMFKSKVLSLSLSANETYISATLSKLQSVKEAIVLKSLLSMLQKMHQVHPRPGQFVREYRLLEVVKGFAQAETQILVSRIANKLRGDLEESLRAEEAATAGAPVDIGSTMG